MDSIVWSFSNLDGLGTHIASIGFNAMPQGPGISLLNSVQVSSIDPDPESSSYTRDCAADAPSSTQYGLIVAHIVSDTDEPVVLPDDAVVSYGGLTMELLAFATVESELADRQHLFAFLWIGDGADLNDDVFNVEYFGVDAARFGVEIMWFEGVYQEGADFLEAGTVDTNTTPLELDPGPDPTEWDLVITVAGQGLNDFAQTTLTISTAKYLPNDQIISRASAGRSAIYLCDTSYNCECDTDPNARTLADMRTELLVRTGYASQATNPPPGVERLMDSYLQAAQRYLWHRYQPLQTRRLFSWALRPGIRYYGLGDSLQCCAGALDRYKIEGAWIQDPNNTWWPLIYGINPTFYTLDQNIGWPNYFEIRQCIELFPAPMGTGYKLWIKGGIALLPFTDDDDTTTLDAGPVLDWAIGLAKSHKGDRDAGLPLPGRETGYYGMAIRQVKELIARGHVTRRYVPGSSQLPIPVPPVMVHFDE